MTGAYNQYYNLFCTKDIGQLGIEFFNVVGHLCAKNPEYVEKNPITLIKEDMHSSVNLTYEEICDLSSVTQIAYVGRVNNQVFEKKVDDGFISYYAVDIDAEFETCATVIKNVQKILMKCSSRHTVVLYRVGQCFILACGYRNVGKNSNVVYSDWIFDDESAEIIIESASVWNLSFRSISKFAFDFRCAIHRDNNSKNLSFEAIAYDIFPQYFEDWGFSEENLPKREDRNEFVAWYYNQHRDEYDGFEDDAFFLTKDSLLEDDYEIDIDELELRMLEAEMRGEEFVPSDDFEKMDDSEFEEAIRLVDGGTDLSDAESILNELNVDDNNNFEEKNETLTPIKIGALESSFSTQSTKIFSADLISGTIDEIISVANPDLPFKLKRTTWKRTDLFFVVEEIRGKYAYGYILDNGQIDRRTSYPTFNEKLKWFLQKEETEPIIVYNGVNAKVTLCSVEYVDDADECSVELYFEIENLTNSELNVYLKHICCGIEEVEGFHLIETVDCIEPVNTGSVIITDDMLSIEYLSEIYDISFMIEIDDSEFNDIETSEEFSVTLS